MPSQVESSSLQPILALRERVLFMGAQVESLVETAFAALDRRDAGRARVVIALDEEIDLLEVEIDGLCVLLLGERQLDAPSLRIVTSTLKLVTDLERAADLGVNVAERVIELAAMPQTVYVQGLLERMASVSLRMLRDAMDAFVAADALKAEQILDRDEAVDTLYSEFFPALIAQMVADVNCIEQATRLQSVAKYIERIADHATNIAEMVVYMVRGKDVRHRSDAGKLR
jgi:phosphate transport system protein